MIYRILINIGLLAFGYYLGREVGRVEAVREQLRKKREASGNVYLGEVVVTPEEDGSDKSTEDRQD
jgi:hypothetical protein